MRHQVTTFILFLQNSDLPWCLCKSPSEQIPDRNSDMPPSRFLIEIVSILTLKFLSCVKKSVQIASINCNSTLSLEIVSVFTKSPAYDVLLMLQEFKHSLRHYLMVMLIFCVQTFSLVLVYTSRKKAR